jgi:biotin carboxyl carrier protein
MKRSLFEMDGRETVVHSQVLGDVLWLHIDGETLSVPLKSKSRRRGASAATEVTVGEILAPMPGKVTQVGVKAGDKVKKGQTALVMEAMKMEYNLRCDTDGIIELVSAKVGEQVQLGDLLVKIKVD